MVESSNINRLNVIFLLICLNFNEFTVDASTCDPIDISTNFFKAQRTLIKGIVRPNACLCKHPCTADKVAEFVKFTYIKNGDVSFQQLNDKNPRASHLYNFAGPVKFIMHGYTDSVVTGWCRPTARRLAKDFDGYVILVDFSDISDCSYGKTVHDIIHSMAHYIAYVIKRFRFDPKKIELIGHSIGAHLAGFIGSALHGRIQRITGLDPAGPMYDRMHIGLNRTCAQFVQVLHTDPGEMGSRLLRGHADFFANHRSVLQPGCRIKPCGHGKSIFYYHASLYPQYKFIGRDCNQRDDAQENSNDGPLFGQFNNGESGVFCFRTTPCFPYTTHKYKF